VTPVSYRTRALARVRLAPRVFVMRVADARESLSAWGGRQACLASSKAANLGGDAGVEAGRPFNRM
jgi:hypothetical protein